MIISDRQRTDEPTKPQVERRIDTDGGNTRNTTGLGANSKPQRNFKKENERKNCKSKMGCGSTPNQGGKGRSTLPDREASAGREGEDELNRLPKSIVNPQLPWVGYSQGLLHNSGYEDVCTGTTSHSKVASSGAKRASALASTTF
ncbi:hypothetical protein ACLB2K_059417 [Fragaria x ananassa]